MKVKKGQIFEGLQVVLNDLPDAQLYTIKSIDRANHCVTLEWKCGKHTSTSVYDIDGNMQLPTIHQFAANV